MLAPYIHEAIELLQQLIATPSLSREEWATADLLENFLQKKGYVVHRKMNNVWAYCLDYQANKPTVLLNSHHDTVKPNQGYTLDPYQAILQGDCLYGLGSNDAGASLVSLLAVFLYLDKFEKLPYNLIFVASAEEEISGVNGISLIINDLPKIDLGIVGEPTQMQMAVAEKGLVVLDCIAYGKAGHAARNEGENAIYKALADIQRVQNFEFPQVSPLLGKVKLSVTQIEAGYQHNVVPDICKFVIDVRSNELYANELIVSILQKELTSEIKPRSLRLNSSGIPIAHPIVQKGLALGLTYFGSPTLSDQALMPFSTLKIGVGDSARSHTADEFVYLSEIENGIKIYVDLLQGDLFP
ncbi:MAG: M20 family metallo-hydrolase [Microscillaceae bacterium]|jgi:acetylornithine deacetylase|nr:M20 family metallo-hydrolase [Microscillaceae bacterium]